MEKHIFTICNICNKIKLHDLHVDILNDCCKCVCAQEYISTYQICNKCHKVILEEYDQTKFCLNCKCICIVCKCGSRECINGKNICEKCLYIDNI